MVPVMVVPVQVRVGRRPATVTTAAAAVVVAGRHRKIRPARCTDLQQTLRQNRFKDFIEKVSSKVIMQTILFTFAFQTLNCLDIDGHWVKFLGGGGGLDLE